MVDHFTKPLGGCPAVGSSGRATKWVAWCAVGLWVGSVTGCATTQPSPPGAAATVTPDAPPPPSPRVHEADQAQWQQALAQAHQGDLAGCEQGLRDLLGRQPGHRDGRMMLADLLAERGQVAEAEQQFREVLARYPSDAQAHHSLGLLLEASLRQHEALACYRAALRHAPDNRLYALSLESLRLAVTAPTSVPPAPGYPAGAR